MKYFLLIIVFLVAEAKAVSTSNIPSDSLLSGVSELDDTNLNIDLDVDLDRAIRKSFEEEDFQEVRNIFETHPNREFQNISLYFYSVSLNEIGEFQKALDVIREVSLQDKKFTIHKLTLCINNQNRTQDAEMARTLLTELEKIATIEEGEILARLQMGVEMLESKKVTTNFTTPQENIVVTPTELLKMARESYEKKDYKKAIGDLEALFAIDHTDTAAQRLYAKTKYYNNSLVSAYEFCNNVIKSGNKSAEIYGLKAFCENRQGKWEEAIKSANSAIATDKSLDIGYIEKSFAEITMGRTRDAVWSISSGIENGITTSRLLATKAFVHAQDKQFSQASDDLERALMMNANENTLNLVRGMLEFFEKENLTEARKYIEQYVNNDKSNPYGIALLGEIYYKLSYLEPATDFLRRSAYLAPTNSHYAIMVNKVLIKRDEPVMAFKELKTFTDRNPKSYESLGQLSLNMFLLNEKLEAEKLATNTLKKDKSNIGARYTLALLAKDRDNRIEFTRLLEEILSLNDKDRELFVEVITLCLEENELDLILKFGQKYLESYCHSLEGEYCADIELLMAEASFSTGDKTDPLFLTGIEDALDKITPYESKIIKFKKEYYKVLTLVKYLKYGISSASKDLQRAVELNCQDSALTIIAYKSIKERIDAKELELDSFMIDSLSSLLGVIIEHSPDSLEYLIAKAEILLLKENFSEAFFYINTAIQKGLESSSLLLMASQVCFELERFEQTIVFMDKARKLNGNIEEKHLALEQKAKDKLGVK